MSGSERFNTGPKKPKVSGFANAAPDDFVRLLQQFSRSGSVDFETERSRIVSDALAQARETFQASLKSISGLDRIPDRERLRNLLSEMNPEQLQRVRTAADDAYTETLRAAGIAQQAASFPASVKVDLEIFLALANDVRKMGTSLLDEQTSARQSHAVIEQPEPSNSTRVRDTVQSVVKKARKRILDKHPKNIDPSSGKETERPLNPLRNTDPYYDLLVSIEAGDADWDNLKALVSEHLKQVDVTNPRVRREIVRLGTGVRALEHTLDSADDSQIKQWASEMLDALDDPLRARPLALTQQNNPFAEFMRTARDAPLLSSAIANVALGADDILRDKGRRIPAANRYNSISREAIHTAAVLGTAGFAWVAWGFMAHGLTNIIKVEAEQLGVVGPASDLLQSVFARLGAELHRDEAGTVVATFKSIGPGAAKIDLDHPVQIEMNRAFGAKLAEYGGDVLSLVITMIIASQRHEKAKLRHLVTLWPFVLLSGSIGFTNIVEQAAGVAQLGAYAKQAGDAANQVLPHVQGIPGQITKATNTVYADMLRRDFAESRRGFLGSKTRILLEATGIAGPEGKKLLEDEAFFKEFFPNEKERAEIMAFLRDVSDPQKLEQIFNEKAGKIASQVKAYEDYNKALSELVRDPRFAKLGFKENVMALEVIRAMFTPLLEGKADAHQLSIQQEVLRIIAEQQLADNANIWTQLAKSAHVDFMLRGAGVAMAPGLEEMIDKVTHVRARIRAKLSGYESVRGKDMAAMQVFFVELAKKTHVEQFNDFARLMSLPALASSSEDLEKSFSQIHTPEIELAITLLQRDEGWQLLTDSLEKGGIHFNLMIPGNGYGLGLTIPQKRAAFAFALFLLYGGLIDVAIPDGIIKSSNWSRTRRFNKELRSRNEALDTVEDEIAELITDAVDGFYSGATNTLKTNHDYGTRIPRALRAAYIRDRLSTLTSVYVSESSEKEKAGFWRWLGRAAAAPVWESAKMLGRTWKEDTLQDTPGSYERWRRMLSLTVFTPLRAAGFAPYMGFKDVPDTIKTSKARENLLTDILRSLRRGDTEVLRNLTCAIYPSLASGMDAALVSKMGDGDEEKARARTTLETAVESSSLEERLGLLPMIAIEIEVLKQGRIALTESLGIQHEGEVGEPDIVPLGQGLKHSFESGYIGKQYLLAQIDDDIFDLEQVQREIRADGRKLEAKLARGGFFPGGTQFEQEIVFDTAPINPRDEQTRIVLTRLMQERLDPVLRSGQPPRWRLFSKKQETRIGPMTETELGAYFDEMDEKVGPYIKQFNAAIQARASDFPRLAYRGFALARGYSPLIGKPTVFLVATNQEGVDTRGNLLPSAEIVGSAPFWRGVPDFETGNSVEETLADIVEWLGPDGNAARTIDAQIMTDSMLAIQNDDAASLYEDISSADANDAPVRVLLDTSTLDDLLDNPDSETLARLARISHVERWKHDEREIVRKTRIGRPIGPEELQRLSYERIEQWGSRNAANEKKSLKQEYEEIATLLSALRETGLDQPLIAFIDPKSPNGCQLVIHNRDTKKETSIVRPATSAAIERAKQELLSPTKSVR